ncbi:MAG: acyl-CoA ligase (AMP-forming), exosortase A system-associated [Gammaproteobacteria bacterium]|nr:acyl-CoA ligase (AMP-forming), exosortase A system-associated [Rhodocyclaceae bacterium]MBU3910166.1 acyl-CoA ligase (AMP-forming), exosortase A system-associated [Gammaproteobacteria bacterium]MBU3989175.1 acyl-CoA ligase (AMP-forming), exosortase A system-associated [Gammaproteobacteria bacterium]MBU4006173.1 acyl-CoA ligase (AMP-forming), exosortase A system-associated [Gammaproteobacteria bacterium]MBU4022628.1 acyl-CoA ligase (AMP-forming), exosortase A system-associated [Gammaproteobac
MPDSTLLHELIALSAQRSPHAMALAYGKDSLCYGDLQEAVSHFAGGLMNLGLQRGERVAIYLEKRFETVIASFGAPAAGGVFVPLNPLLKAEQVAYILRDCNVRVLVTSPERLSLLEPILAECHDLRQVVVLESEQELPAGGALSYCRWSELLAAPPRTGHRVIDTDMVAILYTSGSTGKPKGVVLSHRNMVAGAKSVATYLDNRPEDTLLAALPLSFDAGFSQLTTAFHVGARVVLLNYLLPRDVLKALEREKVTGLTAVPPLYIQLAQLEWPASITEHLRYFANTGGRMPRETLVALRERMPKTTPFLMYGLTEAFRSTFLPPAEVDRRPDSIGKAIPNAEILVLREDGSPCAPNEPGELVHRGALVGMGYWNDPEKTAERYKPLSAHAPGRQAGLVLPELAVFSGDTVRMDEEGFLYFIGRRDEMMKTSGYRVSPTEVEEILYETKLIGECVAFGVEHQTLGQAIQVIATAPASGTLDVETLLAECRSRMPAYMVPAGIEVRPGPLPRNPNGKIDRKTLSTEWIDRSGR